MPQGLIHRSKPPYHCVPPRVNMAVEIPPHEKKRRALETGITLIQSERAPSCPPAYPPSGWMRVRSYANLSVHAQRRHLSLRGPSSSAPASCSIPSPSPSLCPLLTPARLFPWQQQNPLRACKRRLSLLGFSPRLVFLLFSQTPRSGASGCCQF